MTITSEVTASADEAPVAMVESAVPDDGVALADGAAFAFVADNPVEQIDTPIAESPATPVAVDGTPPAVPVPVKVKPITWETERNAAAAALERAGATPREVRVLASLGAIAAAGMRPTGPAAREGVDTTTIDDAAAQQVLAAHRAAFSPAWNQ